MSDINYGPVTLTPPGDTPVADEACSLTVLQPSAPNLSLAKLIRRDGTIRDYDEVLHFDAITRPVKSLADLAKLIRELAPNHRQAVVRGKLLAGTAATRIHRRLRPNAKTGAAATLRDVSRLWLVLDIDGLTMPPGVDVTDLEACGRAAMAMLPEAFHGVACIVQATSGHGIKPGMRLRLWFWLSRPLSGAELKAWFKGYPVDHSIFTANQLIYTASPIFEDGALDPLSVRVAMLDGAPLVPAPSADELAPARRSSAVPIGSSIEQVASAYMRGALTNAGVRILTAKQQGASRHVTIVRECAGLARFVAGGALGEATFRAFIHAVAHGAGKTDEAEIDSAIEWGLQRAAFNVEETARG